MRIFHCDHCSQPVFFENTHCERCGHKLAYLPDLQVVASLDPVEGDGDAPPSLWTSPVRRAGGRRYRLCANYTTHGVCNWAIPVEDENALCASCRLTGVIPDLSVAGNLNRWRRLEVGKRRLIYSLLKFGLPIEPKAAGGGGGLEFRFIGDPPGGPRVLTGHDNGVITVNVDEADDAVREQRRIAMREPYRTLLGHFRHETGHYYWDVLVKPTPVLGEFREVFGDERLSYEQALKDHYANGSKPGWQDRYVSEYASVHPWEDWAETWAHYLHMTDTIETAAVTGLSLHPDRADEPAMAKPARRPAHHQRFSEIIDAWFPLTYALNSLNRGMGLPDLYPFVLSAVAIEKLRFVHEVICRSGQGDGGEGACDGGHARTS